jgi:hypothetical protein
LSHSTKVLALLAIKRALIGFIADGPGQTGYFAIACHGFPFTFVLLHMAV